MRSMSKKKVNQEALAAMGQQITEPENMGSSNFVVDSP